MASKTYTEWKCDRCNKETFEYATNQPRGWGRVYIVSPPKADPVDYGKKKDLCANCRVAVESIVNGEAGK